MEDYNRELIDDENDKAELEAAADGGAQGLSDTDINATLPYTITLSKTYNFEGAEISEVDLSGLEDLTTADAEYIEKVMAKLKYYPKEKFRDPIYTKHIAMRVTNLPVEFFNSLKWKDFLTIMSRITVYFLL